MLSPYDLWLLHKWPGDAINYIRLFFPDFMPLYVDEHICRSDFNQFDKYHGKDILIVGGGPSTLNTDWGHGYDYIWSCNHYFLCESLKNFKVDLAMIMPGVNLRNQDFLDRVYKDNPLIGIELHDRWFGNESLRRFIDEYGDQNMFFSHTRFFGKLGIGARMLILAASLGVKSVSFIGFDGPSRQHSFQKNKYELPSGITEENAFEIYKYQYTELYKHLAKFYTKTKIISIDKTNIFHEMVY